MICPKEGCGARITSLKEDAACLFSIPIDTDGHADYDQQQTDVEDTNERWLECEAGHKISGFEQSDSAKGASFSKIELDEDAIVTEGDN